MALRVRDLLRRRSSLAEEVAIGSGGRWSFSFEEQIVVPAGTLWEDEAHDLFTMTGIPDGYLVGSVYLESDSVPYEGATLDTYKVALSTDIVIAEFGSPDYWNAETLLGDVHGFFDIDNGDFGSGGPPPYPHSQTVFVQAYSGDTPNVPTVEARTLSLRLDLTVF